MNGSKSAAVPMTVPGATEKLVAGRSLARPEAEAVMEQILTGRATDSEIVGLLSALRAKGETVEELVGFAAVMRRHAAPVFDPPPESPGEDLVDTCGTGGGRSTFNVSTTAAFVVAGAGVRVAKHGNRSFSSRCGSADVLEALGARIDLPPARAGEAIRTVSIGFLFAPAVHTAMKHAVAARRQLGGRTVFNLLGPLSNPASASAQVLGVSDADLLDRMAGALLRLGIRRAFVVHGADGVDEISLQGETFIAEIHGNRVRRFVLRPEEFGLSPSPAEEVAGGTAEENARILRRVLTGEPGPRRDIVILNAAAALVAAGRADDFREGARRAAEAIDSGAARERLERFIAFTRATG